jgi:hypothetical protein
MAAISWPPTLPAFVLQEGFEENLPDGKIETQMDVGIAKMRRRYTAAPSSVNVSIYITVDQYQIFRDFYINTLGMGSKRFLRPNPITGAVEEYRFRNPPPTIRPYGGGGFTCSMNLERLP